MDHISEKICFFRLASFCHAYMRQHLFLQDLLCVADTPFARETSGGPTVANEVQCDLPILNDETIVDARFQHLKHLGILHVIANVFKNVPVRNNPEGTENDPYRNINFYVGNCGLDNASELHEKMRSS